MAFRPAESSGGGSWLGVQKAAITNFSVETKYDWAEIYLVVDLDIESSQYSRQLKIAGSFDKDSKGKITTCSLLRKIYYLADAIGWKGGVNADGNWVDENDDPIDDIVDYLNTRFTSSQIPDAGTEYDYVVYVFKEPLKPGKDKQYTRVHNKIMQNTDVGIKTLEEHIAYLKKNGWHKEDDGSTPSVSIPNNADSGDFNIDSL